MDKNKMLIDATHPEETRVVVLRGGRVEEFDFESAARKLLRGNIYLAKVTRVEPSLQAAFVEYGGNRHGFLAFSEIHPDYYQIPVADRQALLDEEARAEAEAEAQADARAEARARRSNPPAANSPRDVPPRASDLSPIPLGDDEALSESSEKTADSAPEDDVRGIATLEISHEAVVVSSPVDIPPEASVESPAEASSDRSEAPTDTATAGQPPTFSEVDDAAAAEALDAGERPVEEVGADAELGDASDARGHIEEVGGDDIVPPDTIENGQTISVEQVGSEDAMEEVPERPRRRPRTYKIQEVIKRRQIILVQVVKEERGNKGAALTTYLSLAGRYTVLMPNTNRGGGISRKITNPQDRKRLKAIAEELDVPEGMGLIIRTAGAARTKQEIKRDFEYLLRLWENVREMTLSSTAPSLVYEEGDLIKRSIRDLYTKDIDDIVVAGDAAHREAQEFMGMLMPSHADNVHLYRDPEPLFARFQIERQLNAMFSPYVTLRSGGYIVINQTEALVSIDVNSGKSTREFSIEETALNTNLEASEEIARQLKLRDLAGLIVIDFIDMEERRNNRRVENKLKDALRHDRARIQVGRISHFGLLEMSRQRLRTGVVEGSTSQCPHCQGTGTIRSTESVALAVLRGLEDALLKDARSGATAVTTAQVALYILNHKRSFIVEMERRYGVPVMVESSDRMQGANYAIERTAVLAQPQRRVERSAVSPDWGFSQDDASDFAEADRAEDEDDVDEPAQESSEPIRARHGNGENGSRHGDGDGQRSRRKRRRRGRRGEGDRTEPNYDEQHEAGGQEDRYVNGDTAGVTDLTRHHEPEFDPGRDPETEPAPVNGSSAEDTEAPANERSAEFSADGEGERADERGGRRGRRRGRRGGRRGRGERGDDVSAASEDGMEPAGETAPADGDEPTPSVGDADRDAHHGHADVSRAETSEDQPDVASWPTPSGRSRPAPDRAREEGVAVDFSAATGYGSDEAPAQAEHETFAAITPPANEVVPPPPAVQETEPVAAAKDADVVATSVPAELASPPPPAVPEPSAVAEVVEEAPTPPALPVGIVVTSSEEEQTESRPTRRGWWRRTSPSA